MDGPPPCTLNFVVLQVTCAANVDAVHLDNSTHERRQKVGNFFFDLRDLETWLPIRDHENTSKPWHPPRLLKASPLVFLTTEKMAGNGRKPGISFARCQPLLLPVCQLEKRDLLTYGSESSFPSLHWTCFKRLFSTTELEGEQKSQAIVKKKVILRTQNN